MGSENRRIRDVDDMEACIKGHLLQILKLKSEAAFDQDLRRTYIGSSTKVPLCQKWRFSVSHMLCATICLFHGKR